MQDRLAMVTGVSDGLRQAIALRLAEEGASLLPGEIEPDGRERTAPPAAVHPRAVAQLILGNEREELTCRINSKRC